MDANKVLLALMKRHDLTQLDVVRLTLSCRSSVFSWTRKRGDSNYQKMSRTHLRLLQLELGELVPWHLQTHAA